MKLADLFVAVNIILYFLLFLAPIHNNRHCKTIYLKMKQNKENESSVAKIVSVSNLNGFQPIAIK